MVVTIFLFFWCKPLAGTCGSLLCGWRGADTHWWAGIHQSPQHWFVRITFLHLCPSTSSVPSPFKKILFSWSFSCVPPAVAAFSSSFPPFLQAPEPRVSCPAPLTAVWCIHPQQPTLTAVNLNTTLSPWKSFHRMDSPQQTEICLLVKARFAEKLS